MRFPADVAEFPADSSEVMNQLKGISNETAQRKAQASPLMFDGTTRAPHMCWYAVHIQLILARRESRAASKIGCNPQGRSDNCRILQSLQHSSSKGQLLSYVETGSMSQCAGQVPFGNLNWPWNTLIFVI
jgi:hypothetical protein